MNTVILMTQVVKGYVGSSINNRKCSIDSVSTSYVPEKRTKLVR